MSSASSSSSLAYGLDPALPLIRCRLCKAEMVARTSKQPGSEGRMFYRCSHVYPGGMRCKFFFWEGSYALLLIKDGIVPRDEVPKVLHIALEDYEKAFDLLSKAVKENEKAIKANETAIKEIRAANSSRTCRPNMGNLQAEMGNLQIENLETKMGNLLVEMGNLQAKMADMKKENEKTASELKEMRTDLQKEQTENKKTAAALEEMRTDLQKLKGSTTVKLRNMALFILVVALIGWFVRGHDGEEAFRHMLSP